MRVLPRQNPRHGRHPRFRLAIPDETPDFTLVHQLSYREKREFYSGLARLIRSGSSLPGALELLARDTPRGLGDFLRALNGRIKKGEPLGDAMLHQRPRVTELEATIISAAGRSGRLDRACDQLARYFDALVRARSEMLGRMAYPLVMLNLTVFVVKITVLLSRGVIPYLWATLEVAGTFYGLMAGIWFSWQALTEAARTNVGIEMILRRIPGIGPVREKFALARFFSTLDAQLEAQVNIWDAFGNAAKTSDSARIITAARQAMPMLQSGERLSEALAAKKVLPDDYLRAFRVAEQTGELDAELTAMAQRSEEEAVTALKRWSEWLPRLVYGMMLMFVAWQIVAWYASYVGQMNSYDPFANQ